MSLRRKAEDALERIDELKMKGGKFVEIPVDEEWKNYKWEIHHLEKPGKLIKENGVMVLKYKCQWKPLKIRKLNEKSWKMIIYWEKDILTYDEEGDGIVIYWRDSWIKRSDLK